MSNKQTNMISIRSDMYPESSLSEKKNVEGVPTVLYVNSEGRIQEVEDARDKERMKTLVASGSLSNTKPTLPSLPALPAMNIKPTASPSLNVTAPAAPTMPSISETMMPSMSESTAAVSPIIPPVVPGTKVEPSALNIIPGSSVSNIGVSDAMQSMVPEQPAGAAVQQGGNFGGMIRAAGPAALLLGAYAAFGRTRSSGLPPATRRRRRRGRKSRKA